MPSKIENMKSIQANCPDGYTVAIPGRPIDMLGKTELWLIHEHHSEPHRTRIPQDYIDYGDEKVLARRPKEWGLCLYFKVVA